MDGNSSVDADVTGETILQFGRTTVTIFDKYTVTRFDDGSEVCAAHCEQHGQADLAKALGYPSAEAMNREHDLAHSLVAAILGLPWSPTLHDVAAGKHPSRLHGLEEDVVLALHRFARAIGVDMVRVAQRSAQ